MSGPGFHMPPVAHVLQYFTDEHLEEGSQARSTSRIYHQLANQLADTLPDNPEKPVALRKLLESKDAAVRACL